MILVDATIVSIATPTIMAAFGADVDDATAEVLALWGEVLDDLARDPLSTADRLDWTAKLRLLEGYRERDGLAWDAPRLHLVDLQYADVRPDKGLYNRLAARGRMKRLLGEDEILRAVTKPPEDTRAYFRGRCLEQYADDVAAAADVSLDVDIPPLPAQKCEIADGRFAARLGVAHQARQVAGAVDRLAVEFGDDVTRLNAGLVRR